MDTSHSCFSIIIPTYNRPRPLLNCLQSLCQLNYPSDKVEIIVVNDGGVVPPIAGLFGREPTISLHTQANAGPAAARNAGAALAKGKFLAFVDDDCRLDPDWLVQLAAQLRQTPACLVGGKTMNAIPSGCAAASQLLIDYLYETFNRETAVFFASNNMALAADRFWELNGFDTSFPLAAGEDRDFCDKWRHAGYELVYVPTAVVYHYHHLTFRAFWRQHFNYGRGAFHFHQLRRRRRQARVKMEPFSFYKDLVLYPWGRGNGRKIKLSCLMLITQLANACGFFYEKWIGKKKDPQKRASIDY